MLARNTWTGAAAQSLALQAAVLRLCWQCAVGILLLMLLSCLQHHHEFEHLHQVKAVALGAAVLWMRRHRTVWQLLVQCCFKIPARDARQSARLIWKQCTTRLLSNNTAGARRCSHASAANTGARLKASGRRRAGRFDCTSSVPLVTDLRDSSHVWHGPFWRSDCQQLIYSREHLRMLCCCNLLSTCMCSSQSDLIYVQAVTSEFRRQTRALE